LQRHENALLNWVASSHQRDSGARSAACPRRQHALATRVRIRKFFRSTTRRFELKIPGFSLVLCCLISSPIALSAQTSSAEGTLTENPVFQQNCAKCHGKTAEGRHFAGPSLVSKKTTAASADDMRNIISNGKHRMPAFAGKLTPEQINTLVEQIKSLNLNKK
jgi:cytochrome c553